MRNKKRKIKDGRWFREFDFTFNTRVFFTIKTDNFIIRFTGGSLIISDKNDRELARLGGYNYLYTGDVTPDEKELFALENGKHFYVISLEDFTQKHKITLPRSYEAIDVYGSYSDDGKILYVPICKYSDNDYKYCLCEYETDTYTLLTMREIEESEVPLWP